MLLSNCNVTEANDDWCVNDKDGIFVSFLSIFYMP